MVNTTGHKHIRFKFSRYQKRFLNNRDYFDFIDSTENLRAFCCCSDNTLRKNKMAQNYFWNVLAV